MTFSPVKYVGVHPFGWQGIIPSKAKKIAEKAVDLITIKLIRIDEQFERLDLDEIVAITDADSQRLARQITAEIMEGKAGGIWKRTPERVREQLYKQLGKRLPEVVRGIMTDVRDNLFEVLDLKKLTVSRLTRDRHLLNEMFWKCGREEFRFIERSGWYFGGLFGVVQMVVVMFYEPWWLLPVFGVICGYLTNWLALFLIFRPVKPVKIGPFVLHGLFLKRQQEVAAEYSELVATKVLTTQSLLHYIFRGPGAERIAELAHIHIDNLVEETIGSAAKLVEWVSGPETKDVVKNITFFRFQQEFPVLLAQIKQYTHNTLDIQYTLEDKMRNLKSEEFVGFLRPAFQEDEWILILVGAVLGGFAGIIQYFLLF